MMRNLLWCGAAGLAVLAGGYCALCNVGIGPGGSTSQCCDNSCDCSSCSTAADRTTQPQDTSLGALFEHATAPEEPLPLALSGVIDLARSGSIVPDAIVIGEGEEPLLAPEAGANENSEEANATWFPPAPPLMPYCPDDTTAPSLMPYADGETRPAKISKTTTIGGFFEESEPVEPEPMPDCREDANLHQQYPGCPVGGGCPASKSAPKKQPWHGGQPPFLPVPTGDSASEGRPAGTKHSTFKLLMRPSSDSPARQPVDTLELRPSDLHGKDGGMPPY